MSDDVTGLYNHILKKCWNADEDVENLETVLFLLQT